MLIRGDDCLKQIRWWAQHKNRVWTRYPLQMTWGTTEKSYVSSIYNLLVVTDNLSRYLIRLYHTIIIFGEKNSTMWKSNMEPKKYIYLKNIKLRENISFVIIVCSMQCIFHLVIFVDKKIHDRVKLFQFIYFQNDKYCKSRLFHTRCNLPLNFQGSLTFFSTKINFNLIETQCEKQRKTPDDIFRARVSLFQRN